MKKVFLGCILAVSASFMSCSNNMDNWGDQLNDFVVEKYLPADQYVWGWSYGVYLKSAVARCENNKSKDKMLNYIKSAMDLKYDEANGLHPNAVISGLGYAYLAQELNDDKYKNKAFDIFNDYKKIPVAVNGGVSHRDNVIELWDDTVYMVGQYLMQMYKLTGNSEFLQEAIDQLKKHAEKLEDPITGLWYHGWDNDTIPSQDPCCKPDWAENPNRRNNEFWGRGNGWIVMTLADLLELTPKDNDDYNYLKESLCKKLETLLPLQNSQNGHWYQLPVYPTDKGNFMESSSTGMYAYAAAKAVMLGIVPFEKYKDMIDKAYNGIKDYSLFYDGKYLNINNVCDGTCIGDKEYYFNRGIVTGRAFVFGTSIMFYDVYQELINRKSNIIN